MKTPILLLTLAAFPLSLLAADVNGKWQADFDTQRGLQKYTFTLKQDGTSITGKATVAVDDQTREADLKEGKIEGDTVSVQTTNLPSRIPPRVSTSGVKVLPRASSKKSITNPNPSAHNVGCRSTRHPIIPRTRNTLC
jgi:hypothetical protein